MDVAPTEEVIRPAARSSVLYALGKLTAETNALAKQQEDLPARLAETMNPRFTALEAQQSAQGKRVAALERWQWTHTGGLAVVVVCVGWFATLMHPITFHLP